MEGLEVLNVIAAMVLVAQDLLIITSEVAWRLAATIAGAALILAAAIRVAAGGGGIVPYVIQWIIGTGLVLGLLAFWPTIMVESFNTADEIARLFGADGITALDVIARGYAVFARVVGSGITGSIWNALNPAYYSSIVIAFFILLVHVFLSLIMAAAILQFWIGGAALPILIPFVFVNGLSGLGFSVVVFVATSVVRLIVLSLILTIGQDTILDVLVPDADSLVTLLDLVTALLGALVILYLAWQASSWATTIARGSIGGTGITGLAVAALTGGAARGGGSAPPRR